MTTGRYRRGNATLRQVADRRSQRENNFFLAIIGFSLLSHIIVAAFFLYTPSTTSKRRPPTLYVDLVMAPPVVNPQRGSAGATVKTATPTATIPQLTVTPTRTAKAPVVVKGKEAKKTAVVKDDVDIAADIAKMKQRKAAQDEQREIQAAIAAMKQKTTATPPAAAAVGSASGTGDEAGSANDDWLQRAVKDKWTWPDRKKKDLSAEVEVEFDATGKLSNYRFIRHSTDARFDDSLKRALLALEPLPSLRKYKATFLFNLDDLQGQ
ncbi:MAG: TonB C-terminal domain-containing protein [Desulfuromonadales bacterium]|nr:TonB C-terminal domain-containing protein [Desulfuromonadales bacterium]